MSTDERFLLGHDPDTGQPVHRCVGRFGPYFETAGRREAPPKGQTIDSLADALVLLRLPRSLGTDASGSEVTLGCDRYGYHVRGSGASVRLPNIEAVATMTLETAVRAIAMKSVVRSLDEHPVRSEYEHNVDDRALNIHAADDGYILTDGGAIAIRLPPDRDPASYSKAELADLVDRAAVDTGLR